MKPPLTCNLHIERFKSIKRLDIPCKRVNVLIGEPDSGKTNILEALKMFSCIGWGGNLPQEIRLLHPGGFMNLFYKSFVDEPIEIRLAQARLCLKMISATTLDVEYSIGANSGSASIEFGNINMNEHCKMYFTWAKHYYYLNSSAWRYDDRNGIIVAPPVGENLIYVAKHNSVVYQFLKDLTARLGMKIRFDNNSKAFYLCEVRDTEGEIVDYSLEMLSDTLKRMFLYGSVLLTCKDSTLILDEPDVYAFPPYPKILGEMIAENESNQIFVTTHNPYFLLSILEKTPKDDLSIILCKRAEDGSTAASVLSDSEKQRIIELGPSVFFNLDHLAA